MIAAIEGTLQAKGNNFVLVKVGGVSFQVFVPTSTLSQLGSIGKGVKLHTHLHLREDNVALYGFATSEELGMFQSLITVSGIGPKIALSMLSTLNPEQLTMGIATGNIDVLTQVPGVGKKVASRIVLELKGKVEQGLLGAAASLIGQENAEVVGALTSLGYSVSEATKAVSSLPISPALSLEEKVKLALQALGKG